MVDNTAKKLDIGMEKSTLVVRPLFHGNRGMLILVCILLASLLVLVIMGIINRYREQHIATWEEVDPVSGVTVVYTDQEPENAAHSVMLLGIGLLGDDGLTLVQLIKIMSFLRGYFDGQAEIVSYKKDSFQTDENDPPKKSFVIVADQSEVYTVRLDLAVQDDPEPNITIEKEDYLWYN